MHKYPDWNNFYGIPTTEYRVKNYPEIYLGCDTGFHRFPEIINDKVFCESCSRKIKPKDALWITKERYYHIPYCDDKCLVAGEI